MGRYYWDKKNTVEESRSVSISFLKKHGYFSEPCSMSSTLTWKNCYGEEVGSISVFVSTMYEENYVRFYYTVTDRSSGGKTDYDYEVSLLTTDCNFGGVRYWFGCPYCGMRVGVLYLAPGDVYFRCRHCNNLSYRSRNCSGPELWGETSRQIEMLQSQVKRWTYRGRPTRKVRRINAITKRMGSYASMDWERLLL